MVTLTTADLQTPALLIRLDRVRHNLARMAEYLGGDIDRWRPHIKTSKIPEVFDLLLEAGLRRFKCATTREMQTLLSRPGEPVDLLVAFAHHGTNLRRVAELAAATPEHRVSVLTESPEHAAEVRSHGPELGLFLDLDPGYHRTGIPLADRPRIERTLAAIGPALRGVHYYDGHVVEKKPEDRSLVCQQIYGELLELVDDLRIGDVELVTSGTPTFQQALAFGDFGDRHHTIGAGTVVYSDVRTEEAGVLGLSRAAHVLTRVISAPSANRITCDAGSKAFDAAAGEPGVEVEGHPWLRPQKPSEEHLPILVEGGPAPAVGSLLELAPRHVCPTVNLADDAVLMDGDRIVGIVPVAARGHATV